MERSSPASISADILGSYGDTLIAIFRRIYGVSFAAGFDRNARLRDLSAEAVSSHVALLKDHMTGMLATRITIASELLQLQGGHPANSYHLAV